MAKPPMGEKISRGFTLIEAVVAVALAGFIIQVGAFSWGKLEAKFRLEAGVWEIHTCLSQARFKAIWNGTPVRVQLSASGYVLESYDDAAKAWRAEKSAELAGVEIQANNTPTFHPEGTVSDLASITVSNARGCYKITIAISGRIKVAKAG